MQNKLADSKSLFETVLFLVHLTIVNRKKNDASVIYKLQRIVSL